MAVRKENHGDRLQARIIAFWGGLSLTRQFILIGFAVVFLGMTVIGHWIATRIAAEVQHGDSVATALFVDSFMAPHLQALARGEPLPETNAAALDRLLQRDAVRSRIVAVTIRLPDGTVAYSTRKDLFGRTFELDEPTREAFRGDVIAGFEVPQDGGLPLLETHSPVWSESEPRIVAVAEIYENAGMLFDDLARARTDAWLITGIVALLMAMALYGVVARGSRTIAAQRAALAGQVEALSEALWTNEELRERIEQSARRAADCNERFLRRLADGLRDGPAQLVGLALLRLDGWKPPSGSLEATDRSAVRSALAAVLEDVRGICGDLHMPEIDGLSLREAVAFTILDHEHRTGAPVNVQAMDLPAAVPPLVKVCLCRFLKEGLNGTVRIGAGTSPRLSVRHEAGVVIAEVADGETGRDRSPERITGRLSLTGLSDRIEGLGGTMDIIHRPGEVRRLAARLPYRRMDRA